MDLRSKATSPCFVTPRPLYENMIHQDFQILSPQTFRCRSMLEAFRLGVVPRKRVEEFTFGRDIEIATMKHWLNTGEIGTLLVRGAYGSGKSHLLEYLYSVALSQQFAVAMASLDPNDAPPSRPKAVFHALLRSFRYKNGESLDDVRGFVRMFVRKAKKEHLSFRGWMGRAIDLVDTSYEENFWNWMERYGYLDDSPTLYDHGTGANIYCNIISGLSWIAGSVLKRGGLIVILDEAENVDNTFYRYQIDKGFNFLHGLASVAGNDINLINEPIKRIYTRPGIGAWFGAKTNLIYHGHNRICYCYRSPSFLKLAVALTAEYGSSNILNLSRIPVSEIMIDKLPAEALKEIFNHICLLYDSAYDFAGAMTHVDQCLSKIIGLASIGNRAFIKGCVEILDIRRFHPELSIGQII